MPVRLSIAVVLAALAAQAAAPAAAQAIYLWVDEQGRTNVTDMPPPLGAKDVRLIARPKSADAPAKPAAQPPFALALAQKQYPVTLYTSPNCDEPCAAARALLNKRGVPFKEVQVWEEDGNAELKRLSGNTQVPTIQVGSSVQSGYDPTLYTALLDTAGYPGEGILPAGTQAAPGRPEGYVPPEERELPKAEPVKPAPPAPAGPYSPGARSPRAQKK